MRDHPMMRSGTPEVEVTELLRQGMRTAMDQRTGGKPRMLVPPGTESRSQGAVSRPDGLTDIPIYFLDIVESCLDHDPHAVIECKRIAGSDRALCRLYVTEGIDRFVSGKYGHRHAFAFMCGYLQREDADSAVEGINRYLRKLGRGTERLGTSTIMPRVWARSSRHRRVSDLTAMDIHHVFLEFNAPNVDP